MQIEIFTLCDAATENGGKINLLGTFDTIYTKNTPFVYNAFSAVVKLRRFNDEMRKESELKLEIIDPDGKKAFEPFIGKIIEIPSEIEDISANAHFLINYQNFEFKVAGSYVVRLSVDNQTLMEYPLYIKLVENK